MFILKLIFFIIILVIVIVIICAIKEEIDFNKRFAEKQRLEQEKKRWEEEQKKFRTRTELPYDPNDMHIRGCVGCLYNMYNTDDAHCYCDYLGRTVTIIKRCNRFIWIFDEDFL